MASWFCYQHPSSFRTWTLATVSHKLCTQLLTWTVDSLTISIWQGRGICGPWVLAAGSTLAAGGLGQTAGGAGRGGFKWRTTSPYPQFGLILLSILFILWWRRAWKYFFFPRFKKDKSCFCWGFLKIDCHSPSFFSFVFSLFHPYLQAILFDLPWPIHHICFRDKIASWILLSSHTWWTINNPFSLHKQFRYFQMNTEQVMHAFRKLPN